MALDCLNFGRRQGRLKTRDDRRARNGDGRPVLRDTMMAVRFNQANPVRLYQDNAALQGKPRSPVAGGEKAIEQSGDRSHANTEVAHEFGYDSQRNHVPGRESGTMPLMRGQGGNGFSPCLEVVHGDGNQTANLALGVAHTP